MTELNNGDRCPFCNWLIVDREWQVTESGICRLCWNLPLVDGYTQEMHEVDLDRADLVTYWEDQWPVGIETIHEWLESGWMPGRKIEGVWYCIESELIDWEDGPTVALVPYRVYPQEVNHDPVE